MKIVVVSGSTRNDSQSIKVATRLTEKLQTKSANPLLIDLNEKKLPMYDDTEASEWQEIKTQIVDSDGFILVTPEWNGSASPGIMNFLTYTSSYGKSLAHKPILIASVSSGAGGSYPIAQLKAFGNKNNFPVFVPEHLRLRDVKKILNGRAPETGNEVDESMHARMDYAVKVLLAYAEKLAEIRNQGIIDLDKYPHGN
jgi:NAD(P)H-dependent FMN reductase